MEIPRKQFEHIAKTFHRGSSHFVKVAIQSANISNAIAMVTPMVRPKILLKSHYVIYYIIKNVLDAGKLFHPK